MSKTKQSFPPLIAKNSKILILGTLPGEDSLKYQQYYGHKRNAFWRIIGDLIGNDLIDRTYADKCHHLLDNGFALWDTLQTAKREGSLDSRIREPRTNDIPALLCEYPNIHTIGFNGKQARKFFTVHETHLPRPMTLVDLPSTSPAYTLAYTQKLVIWRQALYKA